MVYLGIIDVVYIYAFYKQFILKIPFGSNSIGNIGLIIIGILLLIFNIIYSINSLTTVINQEGVYVKFFPFHYKYKFFDWNDIAIAYIRKYSPLMEYGGWGIRQKGLVFRKPFHKNTAYNMQGNIGLQLEFKDKKKVLIGTQMPEEIQKILEKLGKVHKQ